MGRATTACVNGSPDLRCERGSVFAEYTVLLLAVSLGLAAATVAIGPDLMRLYQVQRVFLLLPLF